MKKGENGHWEEKENIQGSTVECDENTCKICLAQYETTDDVNLPRVMCDKCDMCMDAY